MFRNKHQRCQYSIINHIYIVTFSVIEFLEFSGLSSHFDVSVEIFFVCRLQTDPIIPLIKEAFSICKSVDSDETYAWNSFIVNIFKALDLEITDFENFTRPFASIKHSLKKTIKKVITDSHSKTNVRKTFIFQ